jgi:OmcA/MtrC family decaheme c-type cytochrome
LVEVVGTTGPEAINVPVKNAVAYFPITDAEAVPRRTVVDTDKCNKCHGHISFHGGGRTDEPAVCVICHNSNSTDISRRPASGPTPDGKPEQTVDFKFLQHSLHTKSVRDGGIRAYPVTVYGYGGHVYDFSEVIYPAVLRDCEECHLPGTFDLANNLVPGSAPKLGTTVDTGADPADPADDHRISAQSASCYGCHDDENAWMHMQRFNGKFYALQSEIAAGPQETCGSCHDDAEIRETHKMPPAPAPAGRVGR